jgi:hypothetical protein
MRRYRHVKIPRAQPPNAPAISRSKPIFEFSEVPKRTLGDTPDIVTRSDTFTDRGGETITLGWKERQRRAPSSPRARAACAAQYFCAADVPP